ncbi:phosphate-starvation-inducible protein PsiE [Methylovulum psychrotolerans]|jgi:phosphate starvation-inducible membrane PsiE|uniref:Protein PsiE n=1 Tax=Methylovulum psychrotolerans TaxID=1704499 RepID=A0A1Z4BU81_9GAMM|nr:phosphate-starvation-inducible PsiE family protein [Methylovulum psychrotolerans]ASF44793.1 phosphate-starvation-inducible E [Methylovulum psychrotolerans]MBT9099815.1 phosphate-starvation-inducible PsiE family protein [Methylovulum psychrotolerans]POZ52026.1 phosphate-starvation-inducible E [Methylovulum psychrotolerans]
MKRQLPLSELCEIYKARIDMVGNLLIEAFHYFALFVIGASVIWSAVAAYVGMVAQGHTTIDDILLLFIYLELGAMVGIYFQTNAMPVRCLIYIAITALSRLLIADIQTHHTEGTEILLISGSILLLGLSTLVIGKPTDKADKS